MWKYSSRIHKEHPYHQSTRFTLISYSGYFGVAIMKTEERKLGSQQIN